MCDDMGEDVLRAAESYANELRHDRILKSQRKEAQARTVRRILRWNLFLGAFLGFFFFFLEGFCHLPHAFGVLPALSVLIAFGSGLALFFMGGLLSTKALIIMSGEKRKRLRP